MTTVLRMIYVRYLLASVVALCVDFGCFALLLGGGVNAALAAGLGYAVGTVTHWLISSRAVFTGQLAEVGNARRQQQALFLGSALVGLGLTVAVVGMLTAFGTDPRIAKGAAIVLSFQTTYLLRRHLVFGR